MLVLWLLTKPHVEDLCIALMFLQIPSNSKWCRPLPWIVSNISGASRDLSLKACLATCLFFPTQHNPSAELCGRTGSRELFILPNSLPSGLCSVYVALDLQSSCTRETWHPLIGHSLEQRPLCLHSTTYKHSCWEKLKSLFKGWLLKSSTLHEKTVWYTRIIPQFSGGRRPAC